MHVCVSYTTTIKMSSESESSSSSSSSSSYSMLCSFCDAAHVKVWDVSKANGLCADCLSSFYEEVPKTEEEEERPKPKTAEESFKDMKAQIQQLQNESDDMKARIAKVQEGLKGLHRTICELHNGSCNNRMNRSYS